MRHMLISKIRVRAASAIGVAAASACVIAGQARATDIVLPPETARYAESSLPGYPAANALCLICHSADYTRTQPPGLSRSYWKAAVLKMQKTFGAPIPDGEIDPIVDYLVKTYGAERPPKQGVSAKGQTQTGSGQR